MTAFANVSLLLHHLRNERAVAIAAKILIPATFLLLLVSISLPILAEGTPYHGEISKYFFLSRETSLGERYMWALSFLSGFSLMLAALLARSRMMLAFSVIFLFVWFDDSMQYHERFGRSLASLEHLPAIGALRVQDSGELLAWAIAATLLAPLFLWAWFRRRPGEAAILMLMGSAFVGLAFFGAVVDMLHVLMPAGFEGVAGFVEDGGEIAMMTLVAIASVGLVKVGEAFLAAAATRPDAFSAVLIPAQTIFGKDAARI